MTGPWLRGRPFLLLGPQLAEGDALVQARLGRQAQDALADRVAQDLLGAARRLQAGQERDHVAPLARLLERLRPEHVGDEVARLDRRVDDRDLRQSRLRAGDLATL